jgi:hypothetical protein
VSDLNSLQLLYIFSRLLIGDFVTGSQTAFLQSWRNRFFLQLSPNFLACLWLILTRLLMMRGAWRGGEISATVRQTTLAFEFSVLLQYSQSLRVFPVRCRGFGSSGTVNALKAPVLLQPEKA